jgi:hypothetical protein
MTASIFQPIHSSKHTFRAFALFFSNPNSISYSFFAIQKAVLHTRLSINCVLYRKNRLPVTAVDSKKNLCLFSGKFAGIDFASVCIQVTNLNRRGIYTNLCTQRLSHASKCGCRFIQCTFKLFRQAFCFDLFGIGADINQFIAAMSTVTSSFDMLSLMVSNCD